MLVALSSLTLVFDGVDLQLMGVVIPEIMRDWTVARSAFAPVLAVAVDRHAGRRGRGDHR